MEDVKRRRRILAWEIAGFFAVLAMAGAFHFAYEWSGSNPVLAYIFPVNESVWEHFKLGYFAMVVFTVVEYLFLRHDTRGFLAARGLGLLAMEAVILAVYYSYRQFIPHPVFPLDFSSFVMGLVLYQFIGWKFLARGKKTPIWTAAGAAVILAHAVLLFAFTRNPPKADLFFDPRNRLYGIPQEASKR